MSSRVTPGPWVVEGPDPRAVKNPNMGLWSVEGAANVANHCTYADACLIASAPKMRAALEGIQAMEREPGEALGSTIIMEVRAFLAALDLKVHS